MMKLGETYTMAAVLEGTLRVPREVAYLTVTFLRWEHKGAFGPSSALRLDCNGLPASCVVPLSPNVVRISLTAGCRECNGFHWAARCTRCGRPHSSDGRRHLVDMALTEYRGTRFEVRQDTHDMWAWMLAEVSSPDTASVPAPLLPLASTTAAAPAQKAALTGALEAEETTDGAGERREPPAPAADARAEKADLDREKQQAVALREKAADLLETAKADVARLRQNAKADALSLAESARAAAADVIAEAQRQAAVLVDDAKSEAAVLVAAAQAEAAAITAQARAAALSAEDRSTEDQSVRACALLEKAGRDAAAITDKATEAAVRMLKDTDDFCEVRLEMITTLTEIRLRKSKERAAELLEDARATARAIVEDARAEASALREPAQAALAEGASAPPARPADVPCADTAVPCVGCRSRVVREQGMP
jgi:hypothetical protein